MCEPHGAGCCSRRVAGELWQVVFLGAWETGLPETRLLAFKLSCFYGLGFVGTPNQKAEI